MPKKKTQRKKVSKKANSGRGIKRMATKIRGSKPGQMVDDVLVKVSPQVQKRVDQLIETLNNTKEARMGDLKWLAGQILLRSKDISSQLKNVKVPGTSKKRK